MFNAPVEFEVLAISESATSYIIKLRKILDQGRSPQHL